MAHVLLTKPFTLATLVESVKSAFGCRSGPRSIPLGSASSLERLRIAPIIRRVLSASAERSDDLKGSGTGLAHGRYTKRKCGSDKHERTAAAMRLRDASSPLPEQVCPALVHKVEEPLNAPAVERHYTVKELNRPWKLSTSTITDIFRDEPGVLKIRRERPLRGRRTYTTLRIPDSVLNRVHARLGVRK